MINIEGGLRLGYQNLRYLLSPEIVNVVRIRDYVPVLLLELLLRGLYHGWYLAVTVKWSPTKFWATKSSEFNRWRIFVTCHSSWP